MQPAQMLPPCATRRNKVLQPEGRLIPLLPVKPPQRCTQFRVATGTQLFALPVRQQLLKTRLTQLRPSGFPNGQTRSPETGRVISLGGALWPHSEVASVLAKPCRFGFLKDRHAVAATHGDVWVRTHER